MKKPLIITIIIGLLVIAGVAALFYFLSFQKVTFAFDKEVATATLFRTGSDTENTESDGSEIQPVTPQNNTISLQDGSYYVVIKGEKVGQSSVPFEVTGKAATITLAADYSQEYLAKQLAAERAKIDAVLQAKYPALLAQYDIHAGRLLEKGAWYGTLLSHKDDVRQEQDMYRVVLKKEGDTWVLIRTPELVLTSYDYKDVPVAVLKAINQLNE